MSQDAMERALNVKRRHEAELMRKPNVVAMGVGFLTRGGQRTNEIGLIVSVKKKVPPAELSPDDRIPASLEGVPVDVVETGEIKALS